MILLKDSNVAVQLSSSKYITKSKSVLREGANLSFKNGVVGRDRKMVKPCRLIGDSTHHWRSPGKNIG